MINTREELINALTEASELEHGLLIQYLFAAFSLKRRLDEGLDPVQQALVVDWEGMILGVAHDEMKHLGMVCNMLAAIGGAPRFGRPNFPQPAKKFYPWDFDLIPFSDEALYRFICFELPQGTPPPPPPRVFKNKGLAPEFIAPEPIIYDYVGELYGKIKEGFLTIEEQKLFIGARDAQDKDPWSLEWKGGLAEVYDRASAVRAIDLIVQEGEGSPKERKGSHYDRFLGIRKDLLASSGFDPSRPVVRNPRTQDLPDATGKGNLISNRDAQDVAELFNAVYCTALLMLTQYYSASGEDEEQRTMLRNSSAQIMSSVIRPLAEVLTVLPLTQDPKDGNAGPPFELYGDLRISSTKRSRWIILLERLEEEANECRRLSVSHPRLSSLADQLSWLRQKLEQVAQKDLKP